MSTSGFTLDSATGAMSFTPNGPQALSLPIRADEYRNGVLVGSVVREIFVLAGTGQASSTWNPQSVQGDITIANTMVWDATMFPGGVLRINGNLTIAQGGHLTIQPGVTVEFGPQTGACFVQSGGELLLDGCTMRSNTDCNTMWDGIEVWGECNAAGKLTMVNNASVTDAHIGVLVGKSCAACPGGQDPYQYGEFEAQNASFIRNAVGIKLANAFCACHTINNCYFEGGTLLDERYNSTVTPVADQLPDAQHPHWAPANLAGRANFGVWAVQSRNTTLHNSTFTDLEMGINAFDSYLKLDDADLQSHDFTNCTAGIRLAYTPNAGGFGMQVRDNLFQDVVLPVSVVNGIYFEVTRNIISTLGSAPGLAGLHFWGARSFMALDNEIDNALYGIVVDNSSQHGGLIGGFDDVTVVSNCWRGVHTQQGNPQLQIRCTNFSPGTGNYDKNWTITGSLPDQGYFDPADPTNDRNAAGNLFQTAIGKHVSSSAGAFTYFHHSSPPAAIPVPDGDLSAADLFNTGVAYNASNCGLQGGPAYSVSVPNLDNRIKQLEAELVSVVQGLDRGQPAALLAIVTDLAIAPATVVAEAQSASPLSDAVLEALLQRHDLSDAQLVDVLVLNMPVSEQLQPDLNSRIAAMAPQQAAALNALAVVNPNARTPTAIEREVAAAAIERKLLRNAHIIELLNDPTKLDQAVALLETEQGDWAKRALVTLYLEQGKQKHDVCNAPFPGGYLDQSENALNAVHIKNAADAEWAGLMALVIDLHRNGKTPFELDAQQEQQVRQAAAAHPREQAGTLAAAWLAMVFGDPLLQPIDEPVYKQPHPVVQEPVHKAQALLAPNPCASGTNLLLPHPLEHPATLRITDVRGQVVQQQYIPPGSTALQVDATQLPNGSYICDIQGTGVQLQPLRLVVIH